MTTTWKNLATGIRAREHPSRKHGLKPDLYYVLRYRVDGQAKQEALGWSSEGWTLTKARAELAKLKEAQRTGQNDVTLQARRDSARVKREEEEALYTIASLWEIYSQALEGRSCLNADMSRIGIILHRFGRLRPDQIRTAHVDAMRRDLEAQGKSPQTVKHTLALLRRIIRYGAQHGLCPMPDISRLYFNLPKVDNQKTECLTQEQATSLFAALDADHNQNLANMVRLALATGMRRGALLGLQWQDLDFQRGHITLRGEEAKNGKTCTIPMTATARDILLNISPQDSPYLFPGKNGGKRIEVRRFMTRIRKIANLPKDFRPLHGLRHTYASWLASSGKVDLFTLQKLLTHGSPQMTQRYAHLADEAVKRAASVIDECLDMYVVNDNNPIVQKNDSQKKSTCGIIKAKVIPFRRKN